MEENVCCLRHRSKGYSRLQGTFSPTYGRPSFDVEVNDANCDENLSERRRSFQEGRQDYLFDTFRFLLDRLVIHRPEDPIRYLSRLLDDCILFRSGLKEPRFLWTEKHLDALFRNLNGDDSTELLSFDRYESVMEILAVRSYDPCPPQRVPGYVDRLAFRAKVFNAMEEQLKRIVRIPPKRTAPSAF